MGVPIRVLFIEDSADDTELQVRLFRKAGYDIFFERVDSLNGLNQALVKSWDVIISDFSMPEYKGLEALQLVRKLSVDAPFLFVSGTIGEETAVAALKMGARDYLMKNNLNRLVSAVERELRDAADRKRQKLLEQQVHQLQRFEAVGRLAGGVAHDFNNVIGAIMGWAEMGASEASCNTLLQERFNKICRQAERAASLTRQLLAFARRQILQPCNTDLNALIREEISLLKNVIGERIVIEAALSEHLPTIWADPAQMEQVITDLCLYARDAMPEGGHLRVATQAGLVGRDFEVLNPECEADEYVLLTIADTGSGIEPELLGHIFEPFFSTKQETGVGLGLAIVYGIVRQHRGFIEVNSTKGLGTTFDVYLPVARSATSAKLAGEGSRIEGGSETILYAEDDDAIRDSTQQILEKLGYKVLIAMNGKEAVEIFATVGSAVHLVLLDVIMPMMTGPEAAAQIAAIQPEIPVIFATGYASDSNLKAAQAVPNSAILRKPFDIAQLAGRLRESLGQKHG